MIKSLIRIALMSIVFSVHTVLCANAQSYMEPAPWDPDAPDQGTIEPLSATANGSVERPSVVDGTQYTVVAPILRGGSQQLLVHTPRKWRALAHHLQCYRGRFSFRGKVTEQPNTRLHRGLHLSTQSLTFSMKSVFRS